MLPRITAARYAGNFSDWLRFSDGLEGTVDLSRDLAGEVFAPFASRPSGATSAMCGFSRHCRRAFPRKRGSSRSSTPPNPGFCALPQQSGWVPRDIRD